MRLFFLFLLGTFTQQITLSQSTLTVLNFQADMGFQHDSKDEALAMVEQLGHKNGWKVVTSADPDILHPDALAVFDVIVFNNNCGTDGPIFSANHLTALQGYIRGGGGFVGIHCAGAIWKESPEFQAWYERLIGTRLVAHPEVQHATLIIENQDHSITAHLPKTWTIEDEWHKFSVNPREQVNVLLSLDEDSYQADSTLKMGGDHPFTWFHYFEGGRSFFTSLGHTEGVYGNADYQQMIEAGIIWAAGYMSDEFSITNGLILDLNADKEVQTVEGNHVVKWTNQVADFSAQDFVIRDYGVRLSQPGTGAPVLKTHVKDLNGHSTLVFEEDELVNLKEDAFDYLMTGSGYTWFTVLKPYPTADPEGHTEFDIYRLKDVNSFMGNLRNGGKYEGLWGCLDDDLTLWFGSRSGVTFGRFDTNNPKISGPKLEADTYYVIAGRMGAGTDTVDLDLFVNEANRAATGRFPVNPRANPSKLAIGTERDATNHPGSESFDGEIARFLIYERPLDDQEMKAVIEYLRMKYGVGS